jgi:hypothetical protein
MLARMPKSMPDHHDAELAIRVYELRREPVMRESRAAINQKFWPKTLEDVLAVVKAEHPLNAAYRQVGSYWEMVYGFAKHGIVHPDFWLESNGEGLFVFAKVAPFSRRSARRSIPLHFATPSGSPGSRPKGSGCSRCSPSA